LQTFAALYGTWIEGFRRAPHQRTRGAVMRRLARLLLLDALIVAGIAVGTALSLERVVELVQRWVAIGPGVLRWLVVLAAVVLSLPFVAGLARVGRRLAVLLADSALPRPPKDRPDLALAPRRMLIATLELAIVLLVGVPLVAVAQPFLPGPLVAVGLGLVVIAIAVGFWRSAKDLHGHVRAGAQVIVAALEAQSRAASAPAPPSLEQVGALLPGLGLPVPVALAPESLAVGKTLAQLDLRGLTGATALAIHRAGGDVVVPTAREVLCAGDVVALAGTEESVRAARELLAGPPGK
jgi:CPA2 family monovalent cation:H+ antiporter-2